MDDIGPPGELLDDEFVREPLDPAKVATSTMKSLAGVVGGALRRWQARHILCRRRKSSAMSRTRGVVVSLLCL
ncbi:MAG TPA: hypothetical protein VF040_11885 [Ktedonobacterales bacterium]